MPLLTPEKKERLLDAARTQLEPHRADFPDETRYTQALHELAFSSRDLRNILNDYRSG